MVTNAPELTPLLTQDRLLKNGGTRKKSSPATSILLLVIVGLVAVGIVKQFAKPKETPDKVLVVGAQQDILPGTRLGFTSLHYLEIPRIYYSPEMLTKSSDVAGRVSKQFIRQGEPITEAVLYTGKEGLSSNFQTDRRALTLRLDDDALVDHSVHAGDTVDVLVTSLRNGKKFTKMLAQDVLVLMSVPREALTSNALRNSEQNRITFAVTPQQSEMLTEANEVGKIHLALRNRLTTVCEKLPGASESDLLPAKAFAIDQEPQLNRLPPVSLAAVAAPAEMVPPAPIETPSAIAPMVQWVVEVFTGNHKDSISVPAN